MSGVADAYREAIHEAYRMGLVDTLYAQYLRENLRAARLQLYKTYHKLYPKAVHGHVKAIVAAAEAVELSIAEKYGAE